jgi:hypothetical protein
VYLLFLNSNGNLIGWATRGSQSGKHIAFKYGLHNRVTAAKGRFGNRNIQRKHRILTGGWSWAEAVTVRIGQKADSNWSGDGWVDQKSVRHDGSNNNNIDYC